MNTARTLRLGTRRSALAWVQSSQVAAALRAAHPGLQVELVGIDTRGDRVLDKPLSAMEGKEFFTAELDEALREGRVDFSVHSLKDLSLERPADFVLAAVPMRANPRDIALFAPDVPQRLAQGAGLRIGTSSPRRATLLPPFLARALPHGARNTIELVNLRGNVDTRLRRLHEPRGAERHLDGIVLAAAGLSRLFADATTDRQGRKLLEDLLDGLHLMMLPLTEVPGAPGQGALAVECRAADGDTRRLLSVLEHPETRAAVTRERQLLGEHGGGCHQRFGASLQWLPGMGSVLQVAGRNAQDVDIGAQRFIADPPLPALPAIVHAWDGSAVPQSASTSLLDATQLAAQLRGRAVFVAHHRALPEGAAATLAGRTVWTAGAKTWFALAAAGVWVQGCGETLGAEGAARLIAEPLLRLPPPAAWDVLTHAAATGPWQEGQWAGANVIATYTVGSGAEADAARLGAATHIYWSSTAQFERWRHLAGPDAHHASGAGKTAAHIRRSGVRNCNAFPSPEAWCQWTAKGH
ncbi:MAG TPA: hydroxymethylbilane synthase [Steroidobacteraceae bacterium]|nr:hydroxymethylbilane synthase [Steroidobacteraceae bacterium]